MHMFTMSFYAHCRPAGECDLLKYEKATLILSHSVTFWFFLFMFFKVLEVTEVNIYLVLVSIYTST